MGTSSLVKRLYCVKVFVTVFLMITYLRVTVFNLFKDLSQVFMRLTWLFHNKLQEAQGASNTFGEVVEEWVMHRGPAKPWQCRRREGNPSCTETVTWKKTWLISQNACECGNGANKRTVSRFYLHHTVLSISSRVHLQHTLKRPNSARSHVLQCPDNVVDC